MNKYDIKPRMLEICRYSEISCESMISSFLIYESLPVKFQNIKYAVACITLSGKFFDDNFEVTLIQDIEYVSNLTYYELQILSCISSIPRDPKFSFLDFAIDHSIKYYISYIMLEMNILDPRLILMSFCLLSKYSKKNRIRDLTVNDSYNELLTALKHY